MPQPAGPVLPGPLACPWVHRHHGQHTVRSRACRHPGQTMSPLPCWAQNPSQHKCSGLPLPKGAILGPNDKAPRPRGSLRFRVPCVSRLRHRLGLSWGLSLPSHVRARKPSASGVLGLAAVRPPARGWVPVQVHGLRWPAW